MNPFFCHCDKLWVRVNVGLRVRGRVGIRVRGRVGIRVMVRVGFRVRVSFLFSKMAYIFSFTFIQ